MRYFKKAAAILMILVLVCSVSACHWPGETVIKVGDIEISSGVYLAFLMSAEQEFISKVDENLGKDGETVTAAFTTIEEYKQQRVDDKDFDTYSKDRAMEFCLNYAATLMRFKEYGLEFTEEENQNNIAMGEYYWEQSKTRYEENGVSYESFFKTVEQSNMAAKVFDYYYAEGGTEEVAEADIEKAFTDNYVLVNTITESLGDEENNALDEDAITTINDKMEGYAKRINDGETFADVKKAYDEENGIEPVEQAEPAEGQPQDATAGVLGSEETDSPFEKFDEVKSMKVGEAKVMELTGSGTVGTSAVIVKKDLMDDPYYYDSYKESVLQMMKGEEFDEKIKEYAQSLAVDKNNSRLDYLAPDKIDLTVA